MSELGFAVLGPCRYVPQLQQSLQPLKSSIRRHETLSLRPKKRYRGYTLRMLQESPSPEPEDEPDLQEAVAKRDWREFRAALVAGSADALQKTKEEAYRTGHWAHSISSPEEGCFLASHPAYYRRAAPYLTQAVVFITKYSTTDGAVGLVLNRPLRGTLSDLEKDGMFGRSSNFSSGPLASQPVYIGGPDLIDSGVITALHGKQQLEASQSKQPLSGVYVGDVAPFLDGLESNLAHPEEIRLFAGCIRWGPGELESEVDDGMWFCISASPLFALKHCIQLPKPLWVEIMESQGEPFSQIASQVYDKENEGKE